MPFNFLGLGMTSHPSWLADCSSGDWSLQPITGADLPHLTRLDDRGDGHHPQRTLIDTRLFVV